MNRPVSGERWSTQHRDTTRTLQALLAAALGILPLCEIFTDNGWLIEAWLTVVVVIGPAAVLRLGAAPRVWHVWLGMVLGLFWLTGRFVPGHALLGFVPGPGAWHDVSVRLTSLHDTVTNGVAPVHTTVAIRMAVCALIGLFAALVDLIGVVARRGALAGVPLLIIYTVSGAVPRHPVQWLLFAAAALGFLLLLGLDARDDVAGWGRLMPRPGTTRPSAALAVSGQRIAIIAIAVAVVVPLLAPSTPRNVIANAFHSTGSGTSSGLGEGISLDPFAALKGDLSQPKATPLFTVTLDSAPSQPPFYARVNVLTTYTPAGWTAGSGTKGQTNSLDSGQFPVTPGGSGGAQVTYTARFTVSGLGGNPPIFAEPTSVDGLDDSTQWSPTQQLLVGTKVRKGLTYTEVVSQPNPSTELLAQADQPTDLGALRSSLQVPASMPAYVTSLVSKLTNGLTTPYAKTMAIYHYFTDPANGFYYSLDATAGNSGSPLVDFLQNHGGYCQQFAAALGIMLRMAGVPSRVVLGYTHPVTTGATTFTVTTADAHAWDEVYFSGVGWVPFDATPLVGIDGGAQADLPWATHPAAAANTVGPARDSSTNAAKPTGSGSDTATTAAGATAGGAGGSGHLPWSLLWALLAVVVLGLVLLLPATVRWRRRRHRLRLARSGDPDPLWAELSATATDLGYVWSPARSPRQVAGWLAEQDAGPPGSLTALAAAVEAARYAPAASTLRSGPSEPARELVHDLHEIEAGLRARRTTAVRVRSRLWPASLGWRLIGRPRLRRR